MPTSATGLVVAVSSKPFGSWTTEEAKQAAMLEAAEMANIKTNRKFLDGDHWQDASGWVGPWPVPGEGATTADVQAITTLQADIMRGFVSKNAIGEVVERHVGGVIGREARWTFVVRAKPDQPGALDANGEPTLSDEQKRAAARIELLLTTWWDENGIQSTMQDVVRKLLASKRGVLRLRIPSRFLTTRTVNGQETKALVVKDIADALSKIRVDVLDVENGRVVTQDETGQDVGIFITKSAAGDVEIVELTYLDDSGRTVLDVISKGNVHATQTFDLGGRLLMTEVRRDEFISEQMRQAQRGLNFALTMIDRNVTTGGFLEEIIINAKVPGHWEDDGDGHRRYVADPIYRGAGALNWLQGHELEDAQGNKSMTTPSVLWHDPVPPAASIAAKAEHYADILDESDQRHVLMSADATASAVSRVQARADYLTSLRGTQVAVEKAGRWLLETVFAWASVLSGSASDRAALAEFRAMFSCLLDTGPLTPEERTALREDAKDGVIAYGTAREAIGIADPDAEAERIRRERGANLTLELQRATVFKAWTDAGIGDEAAAARAGLSEEETAELLTAPTDETPPNEPPANRRNGNEPPTPAPEPAAAGANGGGTGAGQ